MGSKYSLAFFTATLWAAWFGCSQHLYAQDSATKYSKPRPATKAELASIRSAMQTDLKDADSAKFLSVMVAESASGLGLACGLINAKNSYGAYPGYSAFASSVAVVKGGERVAITYSVSDDVARLFCKNNGIVIP